MFKSDFKFVAKYFQTKRKNTKYIPTNEQITHVDSIFKTFKAITGDKSFDEIYNKGNFKNKQGGITMCEFVQGFVDQGKAEIIKKMLDAKALTIEQIADILKLPVEEVKEIAAKVPVKA